MKALIRREFQTIPTNLKLKQRRNSGQWRPQGSTNSRKQWTVALSD
ncbi:unnamed protein product [Rodentolepis nana]|uniref:Uncharacterized protein n=1 Tax=Rodentolepis nana TaxID=102285 RepID=A0A0R3TIQ3_RODNA|nr:unnamed protein product [Rodentolepis nana]